MAPSSGLISKSKFSVHTAHNNDYYENGGNRLRGWEAGQRESTGMCLNPIPFESCPTSTTWPIVMTNYCVLNKLQVSVYLCTLTNDAPEGASSSKQSFCKSSVLDSLILYFGGVAKV